MDTVLNSNFKTKGGQNKLDSLDAIFYINLLFRLEEKEDRFLVKQSISFHHINSAQFSITLYLLRKCLSF